MLVARPAVHSLGISADQPLGCALLADPCALPRAVSLVFHVGFPTSQSLDLLAQVVGSVPRAQLVLEVREELSLVLKGGLVVFCFTNNTAIPGFCLSEGF